MIVDLLLPGPSLARYPRAYFLRRRRRMLRGSRPYAIVAVNEAGTLGVADYWAFLDEQAFWAVGIGGTDRPAWSDELLALHAPARRRGVPVPIIFTAGDIAYALREDPRFARFGLMTCEAAIAALGDEPPPGWRDFTKGAALLLARVLCGDRPSTVEVFGDDCGTTGPATFRGARGYYGEERWRNEAEKIGPTWAWLERANIRIVRRSADANR